MTDFVKGFIESNIDAIDEKDWEEVIEQWYSNASSNFLYNDDEFNELSQVMSSAGIDFMTISLKARKEFMTSLLSQILADCIDTSRYRGNREIHKNDVLMLVDSDLGFIREEQEEILDDIAEQEYGLVVDFTSYYMR